MNSNNVEYLKIAQLEPFPNHPFKVIENEDFEVLINSIRDHGITSPLLVWETEDGRYILMSGHRRATASEFLSFTDERFAVVPCIIYRGITLEEATIIMVDENARREKLLPSEKAWAYRMKLEAMSKQGKRTDLTCAPMVHKLENGVPLVHHFENEHFEKAKSRVLIGKDHGDSGEQVRRYIRLTYLINALLQYVDDGKLGFRAGVELSYLSKDEQYAVLQKMRETQKFPTLKQASIIKQASQASEFNDAEITRIFSEFNYGDRVSFRVSAAQRQRIEDMSSSAQMSKSEILRTLSNTGKTVHVGSSELINRVYDTGNKISDVGNLIYAIEKNLRTLADDPYIYANDRQIILDTLARNVELCNDLDQLRIRMYDLCDKMEYEISRVNSKRQN